MTGSALAATLVAPCSPLHGTIRGSGHATPTNTSRASTPVRTRRAVVRAATVGDNRHAPAAGDPEQQPESARAPLGARSNSAHSLNAEPQFNTRRRRLSIATYGEGSEDGPAEPQSNAVNASSFLEESRSSVSRRNTALSDAEDATPSNCVMALTLPVVAYAVVGPDATVEAAASLAAQDAHVRCVVMAAAGMGATHVLDRKVVEQISRYSADPRGESLASYLSGAPPSASAGPTATVAAAAGLLLSRGGDYLPVVDEGMFLGLISRADVARVMLAGNPDVFGADLEPATGAAASSSASGMASAAAAALAAAAGGAASRSGPTSQPHSQPHHQDQGGSHSMAAAAAAGAAFGAGGGAAAATAALSLGPPAPSGCLDSSEVVRVTRGTLYCSTQQHQLDLAAEAAHEAAVAAGTAAATAGAAAGEGDGAVAAGSRDGAAAGMGGLFPTELMGSLGALGLAPDFAAAAEAFEAASSSSSAAAALQLRQQAILQKAAAAAMAAAAVTTAPEALAAATLASHAFSPQHTTLQLDAATSLTDGAALEHALAAAAGDGGGALLLTPASSEPAAAAAAAASIASAASLHSHQISPSWSEVLTSAVGIDLSSPAGVSAADAAAAALGHPHGATTTTTTSSSSHQAQGNATAAHAAHHHGHGQGQGQHGQQQQHGQGQGQSLESMDGHGHSTMSLRSVNDPLVSGWDMLDNVDDAMDVLGLVGKTMNAEAVGRALLGELAGAAAAAGGTSSTGWMFKYLYDGDCSICRTFQACLDKLDGGAGKLAFVDISAAYSAVDHGGINFKAAMETVHILSANGQIFKGVTAVLKLLVAVDPAIAAHMGSLTAMLPLLSLSYMLISKNRHKLAPLWTAIVRTTKVDQAVFGRDIMQGLPPVTFSLPALPPLQMPHLPGTGGGAGGPSAKPAASSPHGFGSGTAAAGEQKHQKQHKEDSGLSVQQHAVGAPVPVPVPVGLSGSGLGGLGSRAGPGGRH